MAKPATGGDTTIVTGRYIQNGIVREGTSSQVSFLSGGITDVGALTVKELGGAVAGQILSPTLEPIAGALVALRANGYERAIFTDASGSYLIPQVAAGEVEVMALDPETGLRNHAYGTLEDDENLTITDIHSYNLGEAGVCGDGGAGADALARPEGWPNGELRRWHGARGASGHL